MNTWDDKFDYLKLTRSLYLNVDYLQFLVEKVWKITKGMDAKIPIIVYNGAFILNM